jgi:hypothetical protein
MYNSRAFPPLFCDRSFLLQCAVLASIAYYCVTLADFQTALLLDLEAETLSSRTEAAASAASNDVMVRT